MLNALIEFSLKNRMFVMLATLLLAGLGIRELANTSVDVFPDLNRPTVTIMTEAAGLAPEEVELLVTRPMEYLLNGATGVKRVRSASGIGLSIIWVEFDWDTDIFRDRQIVSEKLQLAREQLPADVNPVLAPISSIMGEIRLLGVRASKMPDTIDAQMHQAMEMRTLAEFTIRNRLLAVEGVSQVTVMGGVLKQYQVLTSPARLSAQNVTLAQLTEAAEKANVIAGAGIMVRGTKESLVRINGQTNTLDDIAQTPIVWRGPTAVRIADVADVRFGGPIQRGNGSVYVKLEHEPKAESPSTSEPQSNISGGAAIIMTVQKQPSADTIKLDREIDRVLDALERELPADFVLERTIFRQASFIESAVENVTEAVRDGAIWVVIILFLLMGNFRISLSSLTSMPLSILLTILVFRWFGITINTMTLGGIAVAIGDLVDDSIVDIENIYRRLKENRQLPLEQRKPSLQVIYHASSEVRNSIVYATLIVILVMMPLFAMTGLEGRLFAPLGLAYIISLLSSLVVSLTFTPVFGSLLLPRARMLEDAADPLLLRWLKAIVRRMLEFTLDHATLILSMVTLLVLSSCIALFWMGGEFLPPFNEGTLTISLRMEPGTSLPESERVAKQVEQRILAVPEVVSVSRRTGRAELDEHAEGVNSSEIDVTLIEHRRRKPGLEYQLLRLVPIAHLWGYDEFGRPRDAVVDDIRERISSIPGAAVNIGQPISHRLDHMMSGVRAQVAVKVFGQDLRELRTIAYDVQDVMSRIPGVVDLQIEPQVEISQVRLNIKRTEAARFGLTPGDIASMLETAYKGRTVSQVIDEEKYFGLVVWFDEESRRDPAAMNDLLLDTPSGRRIALGQVADVQDTTGPNTLNREHVERRVVVFCNVAGRDLSSTVADIRLSLRPIEDRLRQHTEPMRIELSGQFEAQQDANQRLLVLGTISIVGVFLLLSNALESWSAALQVMANVPLAAFGSIITLLIVNRPEWSQLGELPWWDWPRFWISQTRLSLAHWVGFITLIGVVSRNGIMMISHYLHLMQHEGETFSKQMIIRGSLERLAPVMMTAMTSFVGLLPLLFGAGDTGKEILHPLALVVFGGMLTSTLLDQLVTPALFYKFGRPQPKQPNDDSRF